MKELDRLLAFALNTSKDEPKEIVWEREKGFIQFRFYGTVWLGILKINSMLSSVVLLDNKGNVLNDDDDFADDCATLGLDVVDVYDRVRQYC
jgi:hypothetical protein